ncbi:MAG TPA: lipopolysaccharide biosynthesis protein [Planctomycetaceae bacterium]|nr:lipopolysaccharide biosynthesis protein [Planctomycetaceae bacterium]
MSLSVDEHLRMPSCTPGAAPLAGRLPLTLRLRGAAGRLVRSRFSWSVAGTTAARLGQMGCQLLVSVIVSRVLGPGGRGLYATAGVLTALGTSFGNLGLPAANTYEVARQRRQLPELLANSVAVAALMGALLAAALWLLGWWHPELLPDDRALLVLALAAIPIGLGQLLLQHLVVGLHEVRFFNAVTLVSGAVPLAGVTVLWGTGRLTTWAAFAAGVAGTALPTLIMWWRLRARLEGRPRVSLPLLRQSVSYGLRAYLTTLAHALVLRIDILMVRAWLGNESVGQYSAAAALAEWAILVPSVASMLLFPRVAAGANRREQWSLCRRAIPVYLLMMGVATTAAAVLARPAVVVLYGEAFLPAAAVFLWLLPGVFFRGASYPAYLFLGAIGRPISQLVLCFAVVAVNVAGNALLISRWGLNAAAAVSSGSYLLGCAGGYWLARRHARHSFAVREANP